MKTPARPGSTSVFSFPLSAAAQVNDASMNTVKIRMRLLFLSSCSIVRTSCGRMCRVIIYGILFSVFDYEHTFDIILMTLSHS